MRRPRWPRLAGSAGGQHRAGSRRAHLVLELGRVATVDRHDAAVPAVIARPPLRGEGEAR